MAMTREEAVKIDTSCNFEFDNYSGCWQVIGNDSRFVYEQCATKQEAQEQAWIISYNLEDN